MRQLLFRNKFSLNGNVLVILIPEKETTVREIIQEDDRPNAIQERPQREQNPVLKALKKIAENR